MILHILFVLGVMVLALHLAGLRPHALWGITFARRRAQARRQ